MHIYHQTIHSHWKCVLRSFSLCPRIYLPSPESDQHISNVSPKIQFHVYQHMSRWDVHDWCPFNENKKFQLCEASIDAIVTAKLCMILELVMMESSIVVFHQQFCIPAIQKLAFHLPRVYIVVMHHGGNTCQ